MVNRLLLILVFSYLSIQAQDDAARKIFTEAKKYCMEQKWQGAVELFQEIIDEHPESRYHDDAQFWIGYSQEKIPGRQDEAFFTFDRLINRYPQSPWTDDAMVHQVNLAEQFVREGKEQYRRYLYSQLESDLAEVRQRAALSLGKLGDDKSMPELKRLQDHEEFGSLASTLIALMKREVSAASGSDTTREDLRIIYRERREELAKPQEPTGPPERSEFLWFNTQRYEQYRSMLKKDQPWTEQELENFALWHIVDKDRFEEYRQLSGEYDKKEWLRKFWKSMDPTPTTPENELKAEFDRRVEYARSQFSQTWDYTHFRYLPDQYLRRGWYRAPWDARGELYIKYGEPDARSVHGFHTEEWIYYRYGVDFIVKQYMTNIYGNAINAGMMTRSMYREFGQPDYSRYDMYLTPNQRESLDWSTYNTYLDANFVYKNEIRYEHDYEASPLENINLEFLPGRGGIRVRYELPVDEFEADSDDAGLRIRYVERYTVLDEDLREVLTRQEVREIEGISEDADHFTQEFDLNLPPGVYRLAIYIRDQSSPRLGIYAVDFDVP